MEQPAEAEQSRGGTLPLDRELVQRHLQRRFPEVPSDEVVRAIDRAAEPTANAKITTFVPLLVEHRAGDELHRISHSAEGGEHASTHERTDPDQRLVEMTHELEDLAETIDDARRSADADPYLRASSR